jgi:hypothetical protein
MYLQRIPGSIQESIDPGESSPCIPGTRTHHKPQAGIPQGGLEDRSYSPWCSISSHFTKPPTANIRTRMRQTGPPTSKTTSRAAETSDGFFNFQKNRTDTDLNVLRLRPVQGSEPRGRGAPHGRQARRSPTTAPKKGSVKFTLQAHQAEMTNFSLCVERSRGNRLEQFLGSLRCQGSTLQRGRSRTPMLEGGEHRRDPGSSALRAVNGSQ